MAAGIDYYSAATGILRLRKPGLYGLTASYPDHGQKSAAGRQHLIGLDIIYIPGK